ncbi:MAG: hypothetical protein GKR95_16365 [Gammaproteobacteria bacterium]|nr:hypothetical protein [Gammaproteobacteria bacterium]
MNLTSGDIQPFGKTDYPDVGGLAHPCAFRGERAVAVASVRWVNTVRQGVIYKLVPESSSPLEAWTNPDQISAGRPSVSPSGDQIVFAGNAEGFNQGANQLWVVSYGARSKRLEQGAAHLVQGRAPSWSPDGKWIACTSTRPISDPTEETPKAVWIISADGREAHRITDSSLNPLHVAWSPDQRYLACAGDGSPLVLISLTEVFHRLECG